MNILGGEATQGFERAIDIRQFQFPKDHASHQGFRNEWWYFTGNLVSEDGKHFGYQVTFFRTSLSPPKEPLGKAQNQESSWVVQDIWMAHAALTDIHDQQHHALQRFSRAGPALAGATVDPLNIWLDDWQVISKPSFNKSNEFPWQVTINTDDFSLELDLTAVKPPVLQGDRGLSQKSAPIGNASYYYSYSRLLTTGKVRIGNNDYPVTGTSWFDREWSTSALDKGQTGWDWFSLQFDTGEDLMYYQLRDLQGNADGNSQGSWIDEKGGKTPINEQDMQLNVLKEWRNDDGQVYPVHWQMDYGDQSWIIQAAVEDQFMDLAVPYWEGSVKIYDTTSMNLLGRGYLEMTRIKPI
jgi:predicted secreted hydrolase